MPLHPVESLSLGDQVFHQVGGEIISGRYAPGTSLPAERTLAQVFKVNRHVVREALKRLEQLGLVSVSQGGGTKVLDFKRHAGLDLLALLGKHARGGDDVADYWLAVLEMRAAIAADIVRLCTLRAPAALKKEIAAIAKQMRKASGQELFALEIRFWDCVHDGAQNIAYRLAFNSMLRSVTAMGELARQWSLHEAKSAGQTTIAIPIAAAIAAGDAEAAEAQTRSAMRAAVTAFAKQVRKLAVETPAPRAKRKLTTRSTAR